MSHQLTNQQAANLLVELAAVLEVLEDNHFKIRAYKNAAETIEFLDEPLYSIWERGELTKVKGIGKAIADKLGDIFETGRSEEVEQIKSRVPQAMFALLPLEGVGPKKAYRLTKEFNLEDPATVFEKLKKLIEDNKVAELEGFGKKSQEIILTAIESYNPDQEARFRIDHTDDIAQQIITYLTAHTAVQKVSALGSLRRRKSTIGDVDLAVATHKPDEVAAYIVEYSEIQTLIASGKELVRFKVKSGLNVDVKILDPKMWGSLLQHFTGSKQHNVALRERALKLGLSLSEHGIKDVKSGEITYFDAEEAFYKAMHMDWPAPEIRENIGEIEAAESGSLPKLITIDDIKGDFHTHTDYAWPTSHDYGVDSPETMVNAALEIGYTYIAIGDHNPKITGVTDQEIVDLVAQRVDRLKTLAKKYSNITVFNFLEVDIKADGSLALPLKAAELLDGLIVSIHSNLNQSREMATKRMLSAISQPKVKIVGHPTGRLINKREGYELDWQQVFEACIAHGVALEINANPSRLDIAPEIVREAIAQKVPLVINTDAHAKQQYGFMKYGVDVARRGWAEPSSIINTWPLEKVQAWLQ